MELESDTECECIRGVPSIIRRIQELRAKGIKIIYLSDMYLPTVIIQRILEKVGVFDENDHIYVSSEHGLTKSTGNLYLRMLADEQCSPHHILHIGDNYKNDYFVARKVANIPACHFQDGNLNRFEKILRKPAGCMDLNLSWQLIAGSSRVARLQSHNQSDSHKKSLHEVGSNIAGPILWGFVRWVLEQASLQNIRRLYFIARDGQILYSIAEHLCAANNNDIELRYLYGSRQAWHLPAVSTITDRELHWITVKDPYLSLRLIASRLCLDPQIMSSHLGDAGFPKVNIDQELSAAEIKQLKKAIMAGPALQALILAEAERRRMDVIGYLQQEGLMEDIRWALVDSGWNGRLQNSLGSILRLAGKSDDISGFYIGLFTPHHPPGSKKAYLFSADFSSRFMRLDPPVIHTLELMMSADHGITLSYEPVGNGYWKPLLKESTHHRLDGLNALREGIMSFLEHLDLSSIWLDHDLFRNKAMRLLKEFYLNPSLEIATAFGQLPFSTDQTETKFLPFARPLSLKEACRLSFFLFGRKRVALSFWIHGSRVQSSPFVNILLIMREAARRAIENILYMIRSIRIRSIRNAVPKVNLHS